MQAVETGRHWRFRFALLLNVRYVRFVSLLAAAMLAGLFEHPARFRWVWKKEYEAYGFRVGDRLYEAQD